ncbi:putative MFS-type transporter YfiS [Paenibacillus sp. J23TS9]|uniref:MFS transporter n=1 Tax=Paenibacillus sp. J23TS9 TaxID=2807193 RepID=UPI001B2DBAE1|nr:MFS transporter [Paenibacillus sp. J23TS9]GIP28091.1 putative MFS-type transporter YfiS [Paenibacillus sp. J23TS9]
MSGNTVRNKEALMRNRPYMMLMGAQLISDLGDWLLMLALITMVGLRMNATPWEITMISLCMAVPMMLGGPFGGYLSDRVNRKLLMMISDVARFAIVGALLFADSLWQIYIILVLKGMMAVLFSPAKSGKVKELVPSSQMNQAVSISSGIEQVTKIIGPALGGVLVTLIGIKFCFVLDALSYLLSAVLLLGVPGHAKSAGEEKTEALKTDEKISFWKEMGAGVQLIGSIPILAASVVTIFMMLMVVTIADSQVVVLFRGIPGVSENLLGWCMGASGLGTLVAALIAGKSKWNPLAKIGLGTAITGVVFGLAAVVVTLAGASSWTYAVLFASFFFAGFGAGWTYIPFSALLQQRTPVSLTGRVFGAVNSLNSTAVILGPVIGGALVTSYGAVPAFIISGSLTAIIGLLLLAGRRVIERKDELAAASVAARVQGRAATGV